MVVKIDDTEKVKKILADFDSRFVLSAVQKIMGDIFADDLEKPKSAMVVLGDFFFFAGVPNEKFFMETDIKSSAVLVPANSKWEELIENFFGKRVVKFTRYAMINSMENFDISSLQKAVLSLDKKYTLKMIDEDIFNMCMAENWSRDLVSNFKDYNMFKNLGIGTVILDGNEIISGASSYLRYDKGIEIEIDTKENYQKKGLAYICGAKLILECLKNNLYPSWDAHTKISMKLAEKLGYHLDYKYTAYQLLKK